MNHLEQGVAEAYQMIDANYDALTAHATSTGIGRNLLDVLEVGSIPAAMAALRTRCNGTGVPNFKGLMIGDYIDGINLSAIAASVANTAGQAWNPTYKNNRIVIAAFNPYKGVGNEAGVTQNHILFSFVNVPLKARMNPLDINAGGYNASEMRVFLDGLNGDGTGNFVYDSSPANPVVAGAFLAALIGQIGDYVLPIKRLLDESVFGETPTRVWRTYRLFLHSENDVFGANAWGRPGYGDSQKLHLPLYRDSYAYRLKRTNGVRDWYWLNTPYNGSAAWFCISGVNGHIGNDIASSIGGCAPAFCVA
jgi:hypothetical protein